MGFCELALRGDDTFRCLSEFFSQLLNHGAPFRCETRFGREKDIEIGALLFRNDELFLDLSSLGFHRSEFLFQPFRLCFGCELPLSGRLDFALKVLLSFGNRLGVFQLLLELQDQRYVLGL